MRKYGTKYTNKELLKEANVDAFKNIDEVALREKTILIRTKGYAQDPDILPEQREVLQKFLNDYITRGDVKITSMHSALYCIHKLATYVAKPFLEMDRDDINHFVSEWYPTACNGKGYSKRSQTHMNVHVKYFFKWLFDREGIEYRNRHPKLVEHLNTIVKDRVTVKATDLINPRQVKGMINACTHIRDKAAIFVLYDSGCRARELLNLRIKDIVQEKPTDKWYVMHIRDGKTGSRTIYLRESAKTLRLYLNQHPEADDPEAPLFINVSRAQWGRQLKYQGLSSIIRVSAKNAGIKKKTRCHLLRHSRATELACRDGWNEYRLRKQFGWSSTSSTPSIYVHLAQSDFKEQFLKEYGLLSEEDSREDIETRLALHPINCPNCDEENPPDAIACHCGMPLSSDSVEKVKKLRQQTTQFIDDMKSLPMRQNVFKDGMTQSDYQEKLVRTDPILRKEFKKIADELLKSKSVQDEEWPSNNNVEAMVRNPKQSKNEEIVLKLRSKGMSMQEIANLLDIGYGTVNVICKSNSV